MNYIALIITPATALLSLTTACGVLLHDTHLDKAFQSAVSSYYADASTADDNGSKVKLSSQPHTHADGISLSQAVRDQQQHPRTTPRNGDRKHLWHKRVSKGTEFDGNRLDLGVVRA